MTRKPAKTAQRTGDESGEETQPVSIDPVEEASMVDRAADATARDMAIGWKLAWSRTKAALRRAFSGRRS